MRWDISHIKLKFIEEVQMSIKVVLDDGAKLPTRGHEFDAGLDLYSKETAVIYPGESHTFDTGVHMDIPIGYCGLLVSKSGLNVKSGITSTGLIDCGYTGSIRVKLYNNGHELYMVRSGDKISQIVILPVVLHDCKVVDKLGESDRGDNGFGSTGR